MPDIKLPRIPDRTPVKLATLIAPDLQAALSDYAMIYNRTYGQSVSIGELVPHMLESFLASDRGFQKERGGLRDE